MHPDHPARAHATPRPLPRESFAGCRRNNAPATVAPPKSRRDECSPPAPPPSAKDKARPVCRCPPLRAPRKPGPRTSEIAPPPPCSPARRCRAATPPCSHAPSCEDRGEIDGSAPAPAACPPIRAQSRNPLPRQLRPADKIHKLQTFTQLEVCDFGLKLNAAFFPRWCGSPGPSSAVLPNFTDSCGRFEQARRERVTRRPATPPPDEVEVP